MRRTLAMSATTPTTSRSVAALAGLVAGAAARMLASLRTVIGTSWNLL